MSYLNIFRLISSLVVNLILGLAGLEFISGDAVSRLAFRIKRYLVEVIDSIRGKQPKRKDGWRQY